MTLVEAEQAELIVGNVASLAASQGLPLHALATIALAPRLHPRTIVWLRLVAEVVKAPSPVRCTSKWGP